MFIALPCLLKLTKKTSTAVTEPEIANLIAASPNSAQILRKAQNQMWSEHFGESSRPLWTVESTFFYLLLL
jgi:hypothetical protein